MVWVIVLVALVATIAALAALLHRRSSAATPTAEPSPPSPRTPRPAEAPMTGLESALAGITDREGRPIGERIDAETQHVEDLRVPDDTGPLLRRALDHVEHHEPAPDQPSDADSDNQAVTQPGDEPAGSD